MGKWTENSSYENPKVISIVFENNISTFVPDSNSFWIDLSASESLEMTTYCKITGEKSTRFYNSSKISGISGDDRILVLEIYISNEQDQFNFIVLSDHSIWTNMILDSGNIYISCSDNSRFNTLYIDGTERTNTDFTMIPNKNISSGPTIFLGNPNSPINVTISTIDNHVHVGGNTPD